MRAKTCNDPSANRHRSRRNYARNDEVKFRSKLPIGVLFQAQMPENDRQ